jgi:putative transposase
MSTMKSKGRPQTGADPEGQPPPEVIDRVAGLLPEGALEDAVRGLRPEQLSGAGGLLSELAGRVVEAALEAEMTEHLGHPPGGVPNGANVRNGHNVKTVQTDLGPVQVKTPRDCQGSFAPQLLPKRQTRLAGLDEILGLYAGGMTVRDISAHLSELYGTEIGRDTISRITDAVLEDVEAWRTRPLEAVYPIVYFDALRVKVREDRSVRNLACYLALGVGCDGEREVLGIWWQETAGAKFWLAVLNDLHRHGVGDVLIACVDGLKGFPEAIEATFPHAGRRPASCTSSGPACATSTTATSRRSPQRCARSTPPPTPTPHGSRSSASTASGASATPRLCASGRTPGSTWSGSSPKSNTQRGARWRCQVMMEVTLGGVGRSL